MLERKRILVLDDNQEILNAVTDVLSYEDYEIKTTSDIFSFYKYVREYKPHLAIIDYILQGINGGEVCHQLKSSEETSNLPIVIMSAYPSVFNSLGTYGCNDFLVKPFDMNDILTVVKKYLKTEPVE